MHAIDRTNESPANVLCKSCGLCCTGHLFAWTKLRSAELDSAQALGLDVFSSDPRERGFNQPCPLWQGQCTIYASPHYPKFCGTYKCKLLKAVLEQTTSLPQALTAIARAKELIREMEALLPASPNPNFRERLVAELEQGKERSQPGNPHTEFLPKAQALLLVYETIFGVDDLLESSATSPFISSASEKSSPATQKISPRSHSSK